MRRLLLPLLLFAFSFSNAQDYTNRGLLQIKEQSETARLNWNKAFDEAVQNKNLALLIPQRHLLERFLDMHIANMKQIMAQGDERGLLTTIANYLQIEKQYLKNVMVPAEAVKPTDAEAIARVNQQTIEFGQKEKFFLLEINNAIATSGEDDIPPPQKQTNNKQEEDEEEGVVNAKNKSAVMGDEPEAKTHKKLPHEIMDQEGIEEPQPAKKSKGKHKGKEQQQDEEE